MVKPNSLPPRIAIGWKDDVTDRMLRKVQKLELYYREENTKDFRFLKTVNKYNFTNIFYSIVHSLKEGKTYDFQAKAYCKNTFSESNILTYTATSKFCQFLGRNDFKIEQFGSQNGQIKLKIEWSDILGRTTYKVKCIDTVTGLDILSQEQNTSNASYFEIFNLNENYNYEITITAECEQGFSKDITLFYRTKPVCESPMNVSLSNITKTSVDVAWKTKSNKSVIKWGIIDEKETTPIKFTFINDRSKKTIANSKHTILDLKECQTNYKVDISNQCGENHYSAEITPSDTLSIFRTLCSCADPVAISSKNIKIDSTIIWWDKNEKVKEYFIRLEDKNKNSIVLVDTISNTSVDSIFLYSLDKLKKATTYEVYIQHSCEDTLSNVVNYVFKTETVPCEIPKLTDGDIDKKSIQLLWDNVDSLDNFTLKWEKTHFSNNEVGIQPNITDTKYTVKLLESCEEYEFSLLSTCKHIRSDFGEGLKLRTDCREDAPSLNNDYRNNIVKITTKISGGESIIGTGTVIGRYKSNIFILTALSNVPENSSTEVSFYDNYANKKNISDISKILYSVDQSDIIREEKDKRQGLLAIISINFKKKIIPMSIINNFKKINISDFRKSSVTQHSSIYTLDILTSDKKDIVVSSLNMMDRMVTSYGTFRHTRKKRIENSTIGAPIFFKNNLIGIHIGFHAPSKGFDNLETAVKLGAKEDVSKGTYHCIWRFITTANKDRDSKIKPNLLGNNKSVYKKYIDFYKRNSYGHMPNEVGD